MLLLFSQVTDTLASAGGVTASFGRIGKGDAQTPYKFSSRASM